MGGKEHEAENWSNSPAMVHNPQIPRLAMQLVASSFYFEKSAAVETKPDRMSYECKAGLWRGVWRSFAD